MTRDQIVEALAQQKPVLRSRFGVTSIALFGSAARDQVTDSSDIDILVTFDGPADSRRYFGVQFHLEDLFGRPIDLVTDKALRPELRQSVEQDCVYA